jgi:type VI secretion system secreted protein Hcp
VSFSDLSVLTRVDKTTPILFQDAASGKHFTSADLEVEEPNGAVVDYKLSNVTISAVSDKGNAGDSTPLEQVSLNFGKIEWDYTPVNADGSPGTPVSASWGLSANKSFQPAAAPADLTAPQLSGTGAPFLAYLKLDGVDGSSQDANHKDWIEVLSYSEGLSQTASSFGGGSGAGKVSFSDLSVLTRVDKTTPILFQDAASGKHFTSADLEVEEPNGAVVDYKLSNVTISAVSDKGKAGESTPLEQVSLNFSKIEWDYTPVNADGSPGTPVSASWAKPLPAMGPWAAALAAEGGTSPGNRAVDALFADPRLYWLANYLPAS